jgi:hypothetical protein
MAGKSFFVLAETFIEELVRYRRSMCQAPSARYKLFELERELIRRKLISRNRGTAQMYVVRLQKSGAPHMVDKLHGEVLIRSRTFALACYHAYNRRHDRVSLLRIVR